MLGSCEIIDGQLNFEKARVLIFDSTVWLQLQARAASTTKSGYPPHAIYKWSSKFTSMVHSLIMSVIGFAAISLEDWGTKSIIHGHSLWVSD